MKVERLPGMHIDAKQAVAPAASWGVSTTQRSFESALREQRQRITSNDKTSQRQPNARSSSPSSTKAVEQDERNRPSTRSMNERTSVTADKQLPADTPSVDDSPIPSFVDRALAARWRRAASTQGAACIEVVHAASGSRFLLSREDGVWLLTIQSRSSPQDDETTVRALRELFAKRGLGPVDVIKL